MKKILAGILIGCFLATCTSAFAETTEMISVIFNHIKLKVDGVMTDTPTMLYDGRTYIQLRGAAEAFGVELEWDEETNIVSLNNNITQEIITSTETPAVASPKPTSKPTPKPTPKPMKSSYEIGENIIFPNGTEVKVVRVYKTNEFETDYGTYYVEDGYQGIMVELEVLSDLIMPYEPNIIMPEQKHIEPFEYVTGLSSVKFPEQKYIESFKFTTGIYTNDDRGFAGVCASPRNNLLPNVKSKVELFWWNIDDDEIITKIEVRDGVWDGNTVYVPIDLD